MNDKLKRLLVTTPQGASGTLDKASRFVFHYATTERPREVSLGMPLRAGGYGSTDLHPVFAMNRPEGYLRDRLHDRFSKHMKLDDMRVLQLTGHAQIGRLRYATPEEEAGKMSVAGGLHWLLADELAGDRFGELLHSYVASGISGVQPKLLMPDEDNLVMLNGNATPGMRSTIIVPNLIVKTSGEDYPHLTQNEFLCMDAARRAGLAVPDFWLSSAGTLFVVSRFDLQGGRPLGFEDMAVLTNRTNDNKYAGSYEEIAAVLRHRCGANAGESCRRFFEYLALTVLVRNGDAHLKNFGLLYEDPHTAPPKLSPLYDVVTTTAYTYENRKTGIDEIDRTLALKLAKSKQYPSRDTLIAFGRNVCGVATPEEVLQRISDAMSDTLQEHGARMDPGLVRNMRREWDSGRLSMAPDDVYQRAVLSGMGGAAA
ncbi:type II toxin-antitoxin system HipA family toxin [Cupriavidus pampae]|uniref:Type II toxin-antitoxin system HipA family toxin n=1 Tax=Cupriavidus pampae TaxID=659251 RepID=A0ABM8XVP7_9BURK|nr:type II toxin-antitoxin system HipA family toxin [Cupriavidus pampae]CAG9184484.1 hypothetical protein LMG32289_05635 [Cupriavidus pampae]